MTLDDVTQFEMSEMSVFTELLELFHKGKVTSDELHSLLLRSATSDAIQKALNDGLSPQDIAGSSMELRSNQLAGLLKAQRARQGTLQELLKRLRSMFIPSGTS